DIAKFATSAEGYRWLVGGAYAGKSALLYEVITSAAPERVDVVCYLMSQRTSDADSNRFVAAVVPQRAALMGEDPPKADQHEFRTLWERVMVRAAQEERHVLLVVDGLDEDLHPPGSVSVASLLPALAGGHAHVLVSSRPHPKLSVDVASGHPLR